MMDNKNMARVFRAADMKSEMHKMIDKLDSNDHAIMIYAKRSEDENNEYTIGYEFLNVSVWQAVGLLESAKRNVWKTGEELTHDD